ncbi:MAG: hypothetical protein COY40_06115 [Alphaproteobacteria bacterium CG_4_10_14_0_8_um_filter_53_9]|nr:MAG: hypothetical protein COY40_06115 [Alphaproteobacteria bacterium CG_4_10_14_0_8_um_filter_53_9]
MAQKVTYKTHNTPESEDASALPVGVWRVLMGGHPRQAGALWPYAEKILSKGAHLGEACHLPVVISGHGHHVAISAGPRRAASDDRLPQEDVWPLSPAVVRDLAGRLVHTGLNPLPEDVAPHMPAQARLLPPDHALNMRPDEEFMCLFRLLEWSPYGGIELTGQPTTLVRALYPNIQDYPYKIRVDSFYQDGFRPPQTERLYVEKSDAATAALAAEELMARWENKPNTQSYEEFYTQNKGGEWFEDMFMRGCTVIPTLEGFNGYFKVTEDFGMLDVWPGRAVEGLHDVVEEKASAAPKDTILSVLAPGYLTAQQCVPARVVVSSGEGYTSPHVADPLPQLPNLTLPHPRLALVWGATWLPTHPSHFEAPALWDWDKTGSFVQMSGPVWDPVHYVYASTADILKAYRRPLEGAPQRAAVPEAMRPRFHPVISPTGYDTVNELTEQARQTQPEATPWQFSKLDRVPQGKTASTLGYHPLPVIYEYELAPEAFPQKDPRHQNLAECPPEVQARLMDPIVSHISAEQAQKSMVILGENPRQEILAESWWHQEPFEDLYIRYDAKIPAWKEGEEPKSLAPEAVALVKCYLPDVTASRLAMNPKRLFNQNLNKALEDVASGLATATLKWQEASLAVWRRNHRLVRKYPGWYAYAWVCNIDDVLEFQWQSHPGYMAEISAQALQNQGGAAKQVSKTGAPKRTGRLPAGRVSAKVKQKKSI